MLARVSMSVHDAFEWDCHPHVVEIIDAFVTGRGSCCLLSRHITLALYFPLTLYTLPPVTPPLRSPPSSPL
jgi:hypothetical protein